MSTIGFNLRPEDADGHYYYLDNVRYPSVSVILDKTAHKFDPEGIDSLLAWQRRTPHHLEYTKESQIVGTLAHDAILNSLADTTLELPPVQWDEITETVEERVWNARLMWEDLTYKGKLFRKEIGYPRTIETKMVCRSKGYAGTPDLIAPVGEELWLMDLKTSRKIRQNHKLQLGAYAHMMKDSGFRFPDMGALISIHPNIENNPTLTAKVYTFQQSTLRGFATEFMKRLDYYNEITEKR